MFCVQRTIQQVLIIFVTSTTKNNDCLLRYFRHCFIIIFGKSVAFAENRSLRIRFEICMISRGLRKIVVVRGKLSDTMKFAARFPDVYPIVTAYLIIFSHLPN